LTLTAPRACGVWVILATASARWSRSASAYVRTKGSHALYRNQDGRVVVVPQHAVVKRGTLASILRQAGLTSAEFLKLLE
jgi:hypothetical protein